MGVNYADDLCGSRTCRGQQVIGGGRNRKIFYSQKPHSLPFYHLILEYPDRYLGCVFARQYFLEI